MGFESFTDFLAMGGHGLYVWLSYAIALVVVALNLMAPLRTKNRFIKSRHDVCAGSKAKYDP